MERFTPEYKNANLKDELIRRHKIHFGEIPKGIDSYDLELNIEEQLKLRNINDGRYAILREQDREIETIKEKYKIKIKDYVKSIIEDI